MLVTHLQWYSRKTWGTRASYTMLLLPLPPPPLTHLQTPLALHERWSSQPQYWR